MKIGNRWLRLLVGCVTLFMAGVIYAWSIFRAPLMKEFLWTKSQAGLCFTLTLCFFCLGGLFSGLLAKVISMKVRMLSAAALIIAGFTIAGNVNGSVFVMCLSYGVLCGTGIGIVYNVVISATNAWFPDKKGLSSGALMMSFGFSTLLLGKLAQWLFDMPSFGWRNTYMLFGALIGAVTIIAAFIVRMPEANSNIGAKAVSDVPDVETRDMVRRSSYWKLFAFFTLLASVGSTAISFSKDFFTSVGMVEGTAVTFVGLVSGAFYDRFKLRKTQFVTSLVAIVAPLSALAAVLAHSPVLGAVGLCLCGFSYGFSPTVSAAFATGFYGVKNFSLNFAVINLVLIPASFSSTIAGGMDYTTIFIVLACMSAIGLLVNLSIKKA